MLNVIYHKSFKTTEKKKCVDDETYLTMLDYIEWFDSPELIDRRTKIHEVETQTFTDKVEETLVDLPGYEAVSVEDGEFIEEDADEDASESCECDEEKPKRGRKKGSSKKPKTIDMEVELV